MLFSLKFSRELENEVITELLWADLTFSSHFIILDCHMVAVAALLQNLLQSFMWFNFLMAGTEFLAKSAHILVGWIWLQKHGKQVF